MAKNQNIFRLMNISFVYLQWYTNEFQFNLTSLNSLNLNILFSGWNDFTSSVLNHMYSIYYTYEDRKGIEKPSHQFAKDVSKRTWLSSPSENRYNKRRWNVR